MQRMYFETWRKWTIIHLRMSDYNYRSPWGSESVKRSLSKTNKRSNFSGFIVFIIIAATVLALGAIFYLFFLESQKLDVGLEFEYPPKIFLGKQFELNVSLSNFYDFILKDAQISLFLPPGVSFIGQPEGRRVTERVLGDLGPGSINKQSFNLIVTEKSNELKRIQAKLIYSSGDNSSVKFENSAEADVLVEEPAVDLTLDAPEGVFNGQDFEVKIKYANDTAEEFKNLRLNMDYPPIFNFKRSTVKPEDAGNKSWNLGTLESGSSGELSITGNVVGPEKSFFTFNAYLVADFLGNSYTINSQAVNVSIVEAPLAIEAEVNGEKDYVAKPGDNLIYVLTYRNNSETTMQNVVISARLTGGMFDFATLASDGSFNSLTNTITWRAAEAPQLGSVSPGQTGEVSLRVKLADSFPLRRISDKNFLLKMEAEIESATVPVGTVAEKTISVSNLENKIGGLLDIDSFALWRDAASGMLNAGPYPPKVNERSQYTVHWLIKNYATDAENAAVSGFLQSGARFTGIAKSNIGTIPVYDSNSGLVTWNIGFIQATKGVISEPIEAVFQVEAVPAVNQVGQNLILLGESKITAKDLFTGLPLEDIAPAVDTRLPRDVTITANDRNVQP